MDRDKTDKYLEKIESVIANGEYKDSWSSLSSYSIPDWYKKAKFGIFIHWGVYSVPAFAGEWYARLMHIEDGDVYKHHIETYGQHKDFSYADFIPMFKGENFNAEKWVELFKKAGARYVMPVAEHHDGFQMYDSDLSKWNAAKMGPCRDVLAELKRETDKEGLVFCVSSHRAENFWFCGGCRTFDSGLQDIEFQEPYGFAAPTFNQSKEVMDVGLNNIYFGDPVKEHLEDWLVRTCEIVDKYRPKILWFDWWIQHVAFKPYLKKFAAYYYNRSKEWGMDVAINYKNDAFAYTTAVFDVERGFLKDIRPELWQNDTAIAKNSWCYTENNDYKKPEDIVCDLVDVVSKNGCLLLNVGPKSDGTICDEEIAVLESIGKWMQLNAESIYDTTYWKTFGEGPTELPEGTFSDNKRSGFTKEDIRFTYSAPHIYATVLKWDNSDSLTIKSLKRESAWFVGIIEHVEALGFDRIATFSQDDSGLNIELNREIESDFPICFKITID